MAGPLLEVAGLKRSFGGFQALGGVSFRVEAGKITAINIAGGFLVRATLPGGGSR